MSKDDTIVIVTLIVCGTVLVALSAGEPSLRQAIIHDLMQ